MSFIRSLREYLTFLKLQAVNLMAPKPIDVDPFLLLSEDDAKRLSQKLSEEEGTASLSHLMTDEWYLDTSARFFRRRPRTMAMLSHSTIVNLPALPLQRVPVLLSKTVVNNQRYEAKLIVYGYALSSSMEVILSVGALDHVDESGKLSLVALQFHKPTQGYYVYQRCGMDAFDVTEDQAISCGIVRRQDIHYFLTEQFWNRNWKIILVELLRRSLVLAYTTLDLHVTAFSHLVRFDDKVRIYTDGSLLQIDHMVYMGAGAVLVDPTCEQEFTYCARIDYGMQAAKTLENELTKEEYANKTVIIIAGYRLPMHQMLARNSGLRRRFAREIKFPDWSAQDCKDHCVCDPSWSRWIPS